MLFLQTTSKELGRSFWWWVAMLVFVQLCVNNGCINGCLEEERIGLLQLKASINYPNGSSLPSWDSTNKESDCCHWKGVRCNSRGLIRKISLNRTRDYRSLGYLYLNASLFLPFPLLRSLDLSHNWISGWIPNEDFRRLSGLKKFKELFLDENFIDDTFLSSIGHLSRLKRLSLKYNYNGLGTVKLHIQEFGRLNKLEELNLEATSIDKSFLHIVEDMTFLNILIMRSSGFSGNLPAKGWCGLRNLRILDLSYNNFEGRLPSCLANMTTLQQLYLSSNHFNGSIDLSPLSSLQSLEKLDLSNNHFNQVTLAYFFNFSLLKSLWIDNIKLVDETDPQTRTPSFQLFDLSLSNCLSKGSMETIVKFFHFQYKLASIDLSHNKLMGRFPTWLLQNNSRLEFLNLRNNSFEGPFQIPYYQNPTIRGIDISNNHLRGSIPTNLGFVFPNLLYLNMSGNAFEDTIPSSCGDLVSLTTLDLSSNHLSGALPEHLATGCVSLSYLKLSNNNFSGQIFPNNFNLHLLQFLYLDNNHFFGKIPNCLSSIRMLAFDFSNNHLSGLLPEWLGNKTSFMEISLAKNQLEGPIPRHLCKLHWVVFLDLSENNLSGFIPSCFINSSALKHLHLNKNRLSGRIPTAFQNNSALVTLNLRDNYLTGMIPNWIDSLSSLGILLLKANNFRGKIPKQLCLLKNLSMLDLSQNFFSGSIPHCLSNISFEPTVNQKSDLGEGRFGFADYWSKDLLPSDLAKEGTEHLRYIHSFLDMGAVQAVAEFTTKSRSYLYKGGILNYMSGIDLSCNRLEGEIPLELGNLSNIHALNLSYNRLSGSIPPTFGNLKQIESLDLSNNSLNGIIPLQLIELNSLEVFSVAYNNLSGTTPERKGQFITFDESSYEGNPFLCGSPLCKCDAVCEPKVSLVPSDDEEKNDGAGFMDMVVFYISFVVSYTTVLLGIAAVLYINDYWRQTWFNFIEVCMTTCYCFVAVNYRA